MRAAVYALMLVCGLGSGGVWAGLKAGTVTQIEGEVSALDSAGHSHALRMGDKVSEGETLVTGKTGQVHIRMVDDAYLAVVEVAGRRTALVVDALIAQQDIVVKPFDVARGSAPWFSGATVLGDGTPALIVDLGSLT